MLKRKKKSLRLELLDANSETFHGIFVIQDVDHSTKLVVVVLVMLLHIYLNISLPVVSLFKLAIMSPF